MSSAADTWAVLVDGESGNYLATLIDYVHLNPARAGLASAKEGLEIYPWSSLSYYLKSPAKRKPWETATRGLSAWRRNDDAKGRRRYLEHLETRVKQEGAEAGRALPEDQSLQSTLRRGWFFGSEAFKEKLLGVAERALKKSAGRRNYKAAAEVKAHGEARAELLVKAGMKVCELDEEALRALPRGDRRKALIAQVVKAETTVPLDWIAARLDMGARSTVSREIGAMTKALPTDAKLERLRDEIIATDE